MGKAVEFVVAVLFFIGVIWYFALYTWGKVHKNLRKEKKQDEFDRSIKW